MDVLIIPRTSQRYHGGNYHGCHDNFMVVNLAFELVLFGPEGPPTKAGIMDVLIIPRTSQRYHGAIIMGVMIISWGESNI